MAFGDMPNGFGFTGGFQGGYRPGRAFAAPSGPAFPEIAGLDSTQRAAQTAGQFPVVSAGGGATIPGLATVAGGASQIGDEPQPGSDAAAEIAGRAARDASPGQSITAAGGGSSSPGPSPFDLATMGLGAASKLNTIARSVMQGGGAAGPGLGGLASFADGGPIAQVSGGELGIEPGSEIPTSGGMDVANVGRGVGAGLGLIGLLTRDRGISELAGAVGGISQLASTVGPLVNAAISGNAAAFQAATAALSAAAPAAAVAAAVQMALTLANGIAAGNKPEQIALDTLAAPDLIASNVMSHFIDPMFNPSEAWMSFPNRVGETAGLESRGLKALISGLPYVQSQEELGGLVDAYKRTIGQRVGGYGEGAAPFQIPALPEVGPRTHGVNTGGMVTDFASVVPGVQGAIDALYSALPATYSGTDTTDPLLRTFTQFLDRRGTGDYLGAAPIQYITNDPQALAAYQQYPGQFIGRQYLPGPTVGQMQTEGYGPDQVLQYGDPGYNYAASGFPEPGQNTGTVSDAFKQLLARMQLATQVPGLGQASLPQRSDIPGLAQVAV